MATKPPPPPKNICSVERFTTTHDGEGKVVFSKKVDESLEFKTVSDDAQFGLGYVTNQLPVDFGQEKAVETYEHFLANPPRLVIPGGSVVRFVGKSPSNPLKPTLHGKIQMKGLYRYATRSSHVQDDKSRLWGGT